MQILRRVYHTYAIFVYTYGASQCIFKYYFICIYTCTTQTSYVIVICILIQLNLWGTVGYDGRILRNCPI